MDLSGRKQIRPSLSSGRMSRPVCRRAVIPVSRDRQMAYKPRPGPGEGGYTGEGGQGGERDGESRTKDSQPTGRGGHAGTKQLAPSLPHPSSSSFPGTYSHPRSRASFSPERETEREKARPQGNRKPDAGSPAAPTKVHAKYGTKASAPAPVPVV